jgi:50S ribosomal protein L16 3-hydroxylase
VPLKILDRFEPEDDQVLEPGDMLYLPPRYAHDGIADGECQTCSIGFRAPAGPSSRASCSSGWRTTPPMSRAGRSTRSGAAGRGRSGPHSPDLRLFAADALQRALRDPLAHRPRAGRVAHRAQGQRLVRRRAGAAPPAGVVLDRRTRMLYDDRHVFVNGESWRAAGADARLMRRLADRRRLERADLERASAGARELLVAWCEAGWAHGGDTT